MTVGCIDASDLKDLVFRVSPSGACIDSGLLGWGSSFALPMTLDGADLFGSDGLIGNVANAGVGGASFSLLYADSTD